MFKVRISVIMPCYNAEKYIAPAIKSILQQTFPNFELLIIDDGSTDGTRQIIEKFEDPRIRYYRFEKNRGNYVARNIGLRLALGKYISMLDADDIAKPNCLETQFSFLENNKKIGGIGGLSEVINHENVIIGQITRPLDPKLLKIYCLKDNYLTQSTLMVRSHLIRKHSLYFNEDFQYSGDYDFLVRALRVFPMKNLGIILIEYRKHAGQISSAKRLEQSKKADIVREGVLRDLKISYSSKEIELHLKLMSEKALTRDELRKCADWCNRLILANQACGVYHQSLFANFLKDLLRSSISANLRSPHYHIESKDILENLPKLPVSIINRKDRPDRLAHIMKQFADRPEFEVTITEAVADKIGALGLWKSIQKIIYEASARCLEFVVICEDDHEFTQNYSKEILYESIRQAYSNGCSLLSGGISGGYTNARPLTQFLLSVDGYWCNQFIVVFKNLFSTILKTEFDTSKKVDTTISALTNNIMVVYPFISRQKNFGYSDVTKFNNSNPQWMDTRFKEAEQRLGQMILYYEKRFS